MAAKGIYKSKHAFAGSPAQSQLSFAAGATIIAEIGQSGAWWWGRCNGAVSFDLIEFILFCVDLFFEEFVIFLI